VASTPLVSFHRGANGVSSEMPWWKYLLAGMGQHAFGFYRMTTPEHWVGQNIAVTLRLRATQAARERGADLAGSGSMLPSAGRDGPD
jgi:hypothetical protein